MKTRKAITAMALTAMLAMGTAPAAFAAGEGTSDTPTGVTTANGKATGDTTISVETIVTNISATIPLNVKVVGPAEGGPLSGVPSNYQIVNKSAYPIKVTEIKATEDESGNWKLSESALTDASESTANIGDICLTLQMDGTTTPLIMKIAAQQPADWVVPVSASADGTAKNIKVAGSLSQIKSVKDAATTAVKVQYTIAPTTTDSSTPDTPDAAIG